MSRADIVTMALRYAPRLPPPGICGECGKHRYATREAAMRMIERLRNERKPGEKTEASVYHDHGWYHITSIDHEQRAELTS